MKAILKNVLLTCVASGALWTSAVFAQSTTDRLEWPEVSESYLRVGEFVDPRDVARVITGLPKREVRLLLNHPNFSEGLFAVREWDYLFNFLTGKGEEYVTCQYKVLFDKNMRVSSTHWKDEQCAKFLNDKPVKVNQTHPITLSSDGLFAFGRSDFNDLQQSGRDNLRILSGQLKSGFSTLRSVKIVGYTDRIGNPQSNNALSLARANTVKSYLVSQGVPARLITTQGMGAQNPVVVCPGAQTPAVIACLMPNRRIEVSVNGDK